MIVDIRAKLPIARFQRSSAPASVCLNETVSIRTRSNPADRKVWATSIHWVAAVADQAAAVGKLTLRIACRNCIACCQRDDLVTVNRKERAGPDQERVGSRLHDACKCGVDVVGGAGIE